MRKFILALATIFLAASLAGGALAETTFQLDENTALTDQSTIDEWEDDGAVHAEVDQFLFNITIAQHASDVGEPGWKYADSSNYYLRLQYNESIERNVRFFVPSDYWPAFAYEAESIDGSQTAELRPVRDGDFTAVTVNFDGKTDAVFKIEKSTAYVFESRRYSRKLIENKTGINVPSYAAESSWQQLPDDSMTGDNVAATIQTEGEPVLIQFDADSSPEAESWQPVRDCDDGTTDVCRFKRAGMNETVFVMSDDSDPPAVRYKLGGGSLRDRLFGSLNELTDITTSVDDTIKEILPW